MRVAFIQKDPLPDPRLMVLAASTVFRGHQVTVFIPAAERDLPRALRRFAPDALVFSPPTGFESWAVDQARRMRTLTGGSPNLFTGTHATDFPEIAREDGVDLVLLGDPETTLSEVLLKIERGHGKSRELPGTTGTVASESSGELLFGAERQFIDDLDELPLADMEIYRRYPFVRNQTTLSFACGRGVMENTHAGFEIGLSELARRFQPSRRHSVTETLRRLHLHIHRRPIYRRVAFRDDSLLMNLGDGWLQEFLSLYRDEIGLPFSCVARPDQLDAATLDLLAASGCARVRLGVESGDPQIRRAITGITITDDDIFEVARGLRERDISLHTITFLGYPGEQTESALRSLDLNAALEPDHAFGILVRLADGEPQSEEIRRLQLLFPLAAGRPALRGLVESAIHSGNTTVLRKLFQAHHDAAFLTSGELGTRDILGIALGMKRSRNHGGQRV